MTVTENKIITLQQGDYHINITYRYTPGIKTLEVWDAPSTIILTIEYMDCTKDELIKLYGGENRLNTAIWDELTNILYQIY